MVKFQKKITTQTAESIEMWSTIAMSFHNESKELRKKGFLYRSNTLGDIAYALNNGIKAYIEKG